MNENELNIDDLYAMNESDIVSLARKHSYRPYRNQHGDLRIGSRPGTQKHDPWKEAANKRLFEIQQANQQGEQNVI